MKIFLLLKIACKSTCIGFKCSLEFQIPLEVGRGLVRLSYSGQQQMRAWQDESRRDNSWQEYHGKLSSFTLHSAGWKEDMGEEYLRNVREKNS